MINMGFKYIFAILTALCATMLIFSCQKEAINDNKSGLPGTWVYDSYLIETDFEKYTAKEQLDPDQPGFIFMNNGKMTIRSIDGWCATPPVNYQNYEGTWENLTDSTFMIKHEYWGTASGQPDLESTFQIIRVDEQELWLKYVF